jgi:hypothetical protein
MRTGGLSVVKTAASHSPPSTAEVKNEWIYTSTSPICLHDVDRDNITFNLCVSTVCTFLMNKLLFSFALAASFIVNNSDFLSTTRTNKKQNKKRWECKFREVLLVKSVARTESESGTGRRLDLEIMWKPAKMHHGRLSKNKRIICNYSANMKGWLFNVLFWPISLLVAGLWNRRPWFDPRSAHVGFVTNEMALGQVFFSLQLLWYYCISIIPLIIQASTTKTM